MSALDDTRVEAELTSLIRVARAFVLASGDAPDGLNFDGLVGIVATYQKKHCSHLDAASDPPQSVVLWVAHDLLQMGWIPELPHGTPGGWGDGKALMESFPFPRGLST